MKALLSILATPLLIVSCASSPTEVSESKEKAPESTQNSQPTSSEKLPSNFPNEVNQVGNKPSTNPDIEKFSKIDSPFPPLTGEIDPPTKEQLKSKAAPVSSGPNNVFTPAGGQ